MTLKVVVVEVKIIRNGGILNPSDLPELNGKVTKTLDQVGYDCLVGLSGRMPVWAFASLTEVCHPTKGVATYDPRMGLVVVSRHSDEIPPVGTIVPLKGDERKLEVVL